MSLPPSLTHTPAHSHPLMYPSPIEQPVGCLIIIPCYTPTNTLTLSEPSPPSTVPRAGTYCLGIFPPRRPASGSVRYTHTANQSISQSINPARLAGAVGCQLPSPTTHTAIQTPSRLTVVGWLAGWLTGRLPHKIRTALPRRLDFAVHFRRPLLASLGAHPYPPTHTRGVVGCGLWCGVVDGRGGGVDPARIAVEDFWQGKGGGGGRDTREPKETYPWFVGVWFGLLVV